LLLCVLLANLNSACSGFRAANTPAAEAQERQGDRTGVDPQHQKLKSSEHVLAAMTHDFKVVEFDPPGATVAVLDSVGNALQGRVAGNVVTMPLSGVERVWVERRSETDVVQVIMLTLGVLVLTLGVVAIIAAATKESCPFIYSWDGAQFVFDAEPYGGAISKALERDDYGHLEHLRADRGVYRLRVTNEVNETQYTDLMELWAVDHEPGIRLACDEFGGLHALPSPQPPLSVVDAFGQELRELFVAPDRLVWEPMPDPHAADDPQVDPRCTLVLTFPRPAGATRAKLIARASTGLWGSHMIRELLKLRGVELEDWHRTIDADPAALQQLRDWSFREELYVLKVELEEPDGWHVRGFLPGGGPFIAEDRVIALDAARVEGSELRVRLRPPAGFWALDAFAVQWDGVTGEAAVTPPALQLHRISPTAAHTDAGADVRAALMHDDDVAYEMPRKGDVGEVRFAAPPVAAGLERTLFLHSRGHYRLHLEGQGEPDRATLQELALVPDAAARLAARLYGLHRLARQP
jgi:hypothetical protein